MSPLTRIRMDEGSELVSVRSFGRQFFFFLCLSSGSWMAIELLAKKRNTKSEKRKEEQRKSDGVTQGTHTFPAAHSHEILHSIWNVCMCVYVATTRIIVTENH